MLIHTWLGTGMLADDLVVNHLPVGTLGPPETKQFGMINVVNQPWP